MNAEHGETRRELFIYVQNHDLQSVYLPELLDHFTARPGGIYDLPAVSAALLDLLEKGILTLTPARYLNLGPNAERLT